MSKLPLVSVCMITYNHEAYIKLAIEGVLMQNTNFDIELIIADDCSTDQTESIINQIIENEARASNIKYFRHTKNQGMIPNFVFSLQKCQGKHIALCEGDDYWTDPFKLQKQVDFLEGNPEYNICFHNVKIYNQEKGHFEKDTITRNVPETTTILDLARGNFIHTPSVVIRNDFRMPKWFNKVILGDWSLYMLAIKGKKLFKFGDEMAVYRMHDQSIWSKLDQEKRNKLTNENVELLLNNLKINRESKNILRNRLGLKNKTAFFKKLFNKLKQKTSKFA